jgi:hypothetical protein
MGATTIAVVVVFDIVVPVKDDGEDEDDIEGANFLDESLLCRVMVPDTAIDAAAAAWLVVVVCRVVAVPYNASRVRNTTMVGTALQH